MPAMSAPVLDRDRFVNADAATHLDILHCERISQRRHIHGGSVEPHYHDGLTQVFFFAGGDVRCRLDIDDITLSGPSLVWMPALISHAFEYPPDILGWVITIASRDLHRFLEENQNLYKWADHCAHLSGPELLGALSMLRGVVEALEREFCEPAEGRNQALSAHFQLLLIHMHRAFETHQPASPERKDRRFALLRRFQDLIDTSRPKNRSIADYANELAVTPSHLTRVVKALTGRNAGALVHERMILEAKRQLIFSDQSIADIAYKMGFSSASYFSRFFLDKTGENPKEFRKSQRG